MIRSLTISRSLNVHNNFPALAGFDGHIDKVANIVVVWFGVTTSLDDSTRQVKKVYQHFDWKSPFREELLTKKMPTYFLERKL